MLFLYCDFTAHDSISFCLHAGGSKGKKLSAKLKALPGASEAYESSSHKEQASGHLTACNFSDLLREGNQKTYIIGRARIIITQLGKHFPHEIIVMNDVHCSQLILKDLQILRNVAQPNIYVVTYLQKGLVRKKYLKNPNVVSSFPFSNLSSLHFKEDALTDVSCQKAVSCFIRYA